MQLLILTSAHEQVGVRLDVAVSSPGSVACFRSAGANLRRNTCAIKPRPGCFASLSLVDRAQLSSNWKWHAQVTLMGRATRCIDSISLVDRPTLLSQQWRCKLVPLDTVRKCTFCHRTAPSNGANFDENVLADARRQCLQVAILRDTNLLSSRRYCRNDTLPRVTHSPRLQ